ncbi:MAG: type II toxin-antitoxin system VapC family toxin [Chloroflexota bacterium]
MLDASALVAYARREPGANVVAARLRRADRVLVSAVNWAEAAGKLRDYRMTPLILRQALAAADAEIVPFLEADADHVALLTPELRRLGLSLGDRACISLAISHGAVALTAEKAWSKVDISGLSVELIR